MKKYYRVIGMVKQKHKMTAYHLGYTSNKWAWIRHANGWKKENLVFETLYK